jgi:hypothetical protein
MSAWLTPDWIDAFDAALRSSPISGERLTISHVIDCGPDKPSFDYTVTVDNHGASAVLGADPKAMVTFHQSAATAQAIRSGDLAPGEAILLGHVTTSGDVAALVQQRGTLEAIESVITKLDPA